MLRIEAKGVFVRFVFMVFLRCPKGVFVVFCFCIVFVALFFLGGAFAVFREGDSLLFRY